MYISPLSVKTYITNKVHHIFNISLNTFYKWKFIISARIVLWRNIYKASGESRWAIGRRQSHYIQLNTRRAYGKPSVFYSRSISLYLHKHISTNAIKMLNFQFHFRKCNNIVTWSTIFPCFLYSHTFVIVCYKFEEYIACKRSADSH